MFHYLLWNIVHYSKLVGNKFVILNLHYFILQATILLYLKIIKASIAFFILDSCVTKLQNCLTNNNKC